MVLEITVVVIQVNLKEKRAMIFLQTFIWKKSDFCIPMIGKHIDLIQNQDKMFWFARVLVKPEHDSR